MSTTIPTSALQLRSLVQPDGTLQLSLEPTPVPTPGPDEVLIKVQATPINPSDIGLLLGPADLSTVQVSGTAERPVATARIPDRAMPNMAARLGQSMPVGNEAMNAMAGSSWSYSRNVTVGVASDIIYMHPASSWYPSMSQAGFVNPSGGDYRFGSGSPYKGKAGDGRDPGVDYDELNRRTAGVVIR